MQRLEVSGAVRPIYGSLGVKRLNTLCSLFPISIFRGRPAEFVNLESKDKKKKRKVLPLQARCGPEGG